MKDCDSGESADVIIGVVTLSGITGFHGSLQYQLAGYSRAGMPRQPDNIFAGTQVVSLVQVRGTNNSLVHPRGAVGVVTRTPTGDQTKFLVRFPDGFETSLAREQLEVLKHFKDRIPDVERSVGEFDLEKLVIYRCVVGSRAYGLDTDEADIAFHESEYRRLRSELQTAHDASRLPELPSDQTRAALNDLLVRVRLRSAM